MAGWGPFIAGVIYDATGSYDLTWTFSALLNVLAVVLLVRSEPPRSARA